MDAEDQKNMVCGVKNTRYFLLVASYLCHTAGILQFSAIYPTIEAAEQVLPTFYFLSFASLILSTVVVLLGPESRATCLVLMLEATVVFLIGYSLGCHLEIETVYTTTLIMLAIFNLPVPYGSILSFIVILVTVLLQKPINAWHITFSQPSRAAVFSLSVYLSIVALLASLAKIYLRTSQKQGSKIERLKDSEKHLGDALLRFQHYTEILEIRSKEEERKRIARDLHDIAGYTFVTLIMMLEATLDKAGSKEIESLLRKIIDQVKNGLSQTRNSIKRLRSMEQNNLDVLHSIHRLVTNFKNATGLEVNVNYATRNASFSKEIDDTIYRIVQEGLINAFRHGEATRVELQLLQYDSILYITIRDNGRGSREIVEGMGLSGMKERIQALDGQLRLSASKYGFELNALIPLPENKMEKSWILSKSY